MRSCASWPGRRASGASSTSPSPSWRTVRPQSPKLCVRSTCRESDMPRFAYTAVAADGTATKGSVKFTSREEAELALYERELRDIRVTEKKSILQFEISGPRVKLADLMNLSRQMAAFVRAGLPILDAVRTIAEDTDNSSVRRVMQDIEQGLR